MLSMLAELLRFAVDLKRLKIYKVEYFLLSLPNKLESVLSKIKER